MYYYQNDHLGAPYKIIDNTGFVVWSAQFDSFGQAHLDSNNLIVNNLRFPGQYYDDESGLHYNWHRYYDPALGRYISSDPIGLAGGANRYGYAYQSSVIYVDVDGRLAVNVGAAFIGGVLGAYYAAGPNASLASVAQGAFIGTYSAFFVSSSILGRFAFGMATNAAGQMGDCNGFDLSQFAAAGVIGIINPGALAAGGVARGLVNNPTFTNRAIETAAGQIANRAINNGF